MLLRTWGIFFPSRLAHNAHERGTFRFFALSEIAAVTLIAVMHAQQRLDAGSDWSPLFSFLAHLWRPHAFKMHLLSREVPSQSRYAQRRVGFHSSVCSCRKECSTGCSL